MANRKSVQRAHYLVKQAVAKRQLSEPANCELCGTPYIRFASGRANIVGHHYAGYEGENAVKVWWICWKCNTALNGKHDGSLTQEQARAFIQSK